MNEKSQWLIYVTFTSNFRFRQCFNHKWTCLYEESHWSALSLTFTTCTYRNTVVLYCKLEINTLSYKYK